jgi:hypothetical protein
MIVAAGAINVIEQVNEFIVRNGGLKFFQLTPIRRPTESAQVGGGIVRQLFIDGANGGRAGEEKQGESAQEK